MQDKFITQIQNSLSKTGNYPETLEDFGKPLVKSVQLKNFLNSVFGVDAVVEAYDKESVFSKGEWNMGCCDSVFITSTGKVVKVDNSEWGEMIKCGTVRLKQETNGLTALESLTKFQQGVETIRHYLITMACQEDYDALIGICDKLLETNKGDNV